MTSSLDSDSFAKPISEGATPHRTPHLAPQTPQNGADQSETEATAKEEGEAIDSAKDVISLDLSVLGNLPSFDQSAPTRTRT